MEMLYNSILLCKEPAKNRNGDANFMQKCVGYIWRELARGWGRLSKYSSHIQKNDLQEYK